MWCRYKKKKGQWSKKQAGRSTSGCITCDEAVLCLKTQCWLRLGLAAQEGCATACHSRSQGRGLTSHMFPDHQVPVIGLCCSVHSFLFGPMITLQC
ncbi:hypothetical protein VTO42DRAFT_3787 [Malbranchea cinnamomea]